MITAVCYRDVYQQLDSPVLRNIDPDCEFLTWGHFEDEFHDVQSIFNMPESRVTFADNAHFGLFNQDGKVQN